LLFVLSIGDAGVGVLVVSRDVQDDDAILLSCLERVSYTKVFFAYCGILVLPVLFFDFPGAALDEISDYRAVHGCVVGCMRCRAGRGQRPMMSRT
jgi:hypothetical protein